MRVSPYVYALATWFFVAVMNACVKGLDHSVPLALIALSRFGIGFLLFCPAIIKAGGFLAVLARTRHPRKQMTRATLSLIGVMCSFYAVPLLPLGDASALWNSFAFFLLLLSWPLLGEKIEVRHYAICALGFIGVLLIAQPHGTAQLMPLVLILLSAMTAAVTTLTVRLMSRDDPELTIITWMFGVSALISFIWWAAFAPKDALTTLQALLLIGAGMSGSLSQLCMTRAFKSAGAQIMGPYTYSGIVFSVILGFLFFNEVPTVWMLAGGLLIAGAIQANHVFGTETKRSR